MFILRRDEIRRAWPYALAVIVTVFWTLQSHAIGAEFRFANGPYKNVLYLIGKIVPGDYERFVTSIQSRGANFISFQLRSGGGDVDEAIKIGRLVRGLYMYVYAPLDRKMAGNVQAIGNCDFNQKLVGRAVPCLCGSACTLIFFAGAFRNGSELYVHRIAYGREYFSSLSPEEAQLQYDLGMHKIRSYLAEMGIDDKWYHRMLRTASSNFDKVSFQESVEFFGWIPGLAEWFTARCGTEIEAYKRGSNCWAESYEQARKAAYKRLLNLE